MLIYIAGPYTKGDVAANVKAAIDAADQIIELGHTPYIPHLTHFWHLVSPHPYEFWLAYDMVWLDKCDALLRLPGESSGADKEMEHATDVMQIPIYHFISEVPKVFKFE